LIAVDFSFLTCFPFLWQDVYNFMLDSGMDPVALDIPLGSSLMSNLQAMKYSTSHRGQDSQPDSNTIDGIMNGVIKQKLKIIPKNFTSVCAHLYRITVGRFPVSVVTLHFQMYIGGASNPTRSTTRWSTIS
jgi:hypothetical protein